MPRSTITLAPRYPRALQPKPAVAILQAVEAAPTLARLVKLARESSDWLSAVTQLLPLALRSGVQAGPIDGPEWCLLAANSAVAAKLRQLSPALTAHLRSKGWEVHSIRIKVQMQPL